MKIQNIQPAIHMVFRSKIIDAHAHIGFHDNQLLTKKDLDVFIKSKLPNNDNVEKIFVSDIDVLHGTKTEYQGNKDTLCLLGKDYHYELFASCNPKKGNVEEIKKLFEENMDKKGKNTRSKFIGLKFHPEIQNLSPLDSRYEPYLQFADEIKIPCLFHTQVNLDEKGRLTENINKLSDPQIIYETAKKHKSTPFVMAHLGAGWNEAHDKTINVLISSIINGDADLYADISWVDIGLEGEYRPQKEHIIKAIKALKGIDRKNWEYGDQSFRLIFGTDAPLGRFKPDERPYARLNYTNFIEDIKNAIKSDKILKKDAEKIINDLFYNNAKKLFLSHRF